MSKTENGEDDRAHGAAAGVEQIVIEIVVVVVTGKGKGNGNETGGATEIEIVKGQGAHAGEATVRAAGVRVGAGTIVRQT